jgi:hypothetical protein
VAAAKATETTRAAWLAAVQASQTEQATTKAFVSVFKQVVLAAFAGQVDTLADFGLTPRKARVVAPDVQVAAAAKAKATRAARHTMGPNQKAAIRGTVAPARSVPTPSVPTPEAKGPAPVP